MPKKRSLSVNLIKKRGSDVVDKFIDWALNAGRLLVIITEVIALSSFLYRFGLDRQLIDLHSKIKQEETLVAAFKDKEASYRNLQDRIQLADKLSSTSQSQIKLLKDVVNLAPEGMTFEQLGISENSVSINAKYTFISSLTEFINLLKGYKKIKDVSINSIENRLSTGELVVYITAGVIPENQENPESLENK